MNAINRLFIGLICLCSVSAVAQKMVPHSFRYQTDTSDRDTSGGNQLRFLTQVSQPNTTFLRLYFTGTQLGESSYLVLEGTDGTRQELRKQDLENWHYSSAYFNGQSVNVSLFAATGERNTVHISEVKVTDPQAGQARNARKAAKTGGSSLQTATTTPANLTATYPHAKAVGRFTNGVDATGTGWIAPNGAIVTTHIMYEIYHNRSDKLNSGYDVIEFNVPPSVGSTVMHPSPQDQYPLKIRNPARKSEMIFKEFSNLQAYPFDYGWVVYEPLPNSTTGLRPGESQQEYFRIGLNPGNFTIDSKGNGGLPVDIFHYGHSTNDEILGGSTTYRTLQLMQTSLLKQNEHLTTLNNGDRDRFLLYNTPNAMYGEYGAPITYPGSNLAIGVHNSSTSTLVSHFQKDVTLPGYGLGFRDEAFRDEVARFYTEKSAYLDVDGASDQPNGQIHKPYLTVQQAAQHAPNDYTVNIAKGTYSGAVTFNRPLTLRAPVGKVVIGSSNGGARKSAESSIAHNVAMAEAMGAHSRLESSETKEKVRAYPNPFREQTEIKYPFAEGGPVSVRILNTAGIRVATFNQTEAATERNGVQWNGTDQSGMPVPAGLYIIKVNDGRQTFTTKVLKQ